MYIYTLLYTTSNQEGWEKKRAIWFLTSISQVRKWRLCEAALCCAAGGWWTATQWTLVQWRQAVDIAMALAFAITRVWSTICQSTTLGLRCKNLGPISIHGPWWNSGWCDLEVWKAHQFCNLCMFTNQQVSLWVPIYHHFVHGIIPQMAITYQHVRFANKSLAHVIIYIYHIIYIYIYKNDFYQHVCVCHGGN